ncbi:MIP/aquaporin family protein [Ktedonobacter robiniae]|uniref:Aquaporin n=1 Tax=Ktedonobacter robiniae TaxID=2778365 RepID=A0ABQ3UGQ8_9CHLR|nr:MIP/aquaporin family protein [Ktedonobacter robiniae]GHO51893.1 aquaporin [Ktedonobacter robiniae]
MANRAVHPATPLAGVGGEALAEFIGTFVLVLLGNGAVASFLLFNNIAGTNAFFANTWPVVFFGWGFALMLGIYIAGAISGAHLNPAVTISFAATRRFPWNKVGPYIVAQFLGAFVAAAFLFFVYRGAITHTLGGASLNAANVNKVGLAFYTGKRDFVGLFGAFCAEALGTAMLVGLILAIVDARNQPVQANLNPLIIGLVLAAIGCSLGIITGFAVNPARDFGPRLWMTLAGGGLGALNSYTWVPIVAPIVGGLIAAFGYDYTIGRVLAERGMTRSGTAVTRGEAVREPDMHVDTGGHPIREETRGRPVREEGRGRTFRER